MPSINSSFRAVQTDPTSLAHDCQHCWMLHIASFCKTLSNIFLSQARALHMVSKVLRVVSFLRYTAGPIIIGSCYIRLHISANTVVTTTNIVGPTMLGVVASVCT